MNPRLIETFALLAASALAVGLHAQTIYPADSGFESPDLGSGGGAYEYDPSGTGWTYTADDAHSGAGIAANNSAFDVEGAGAGQGSDSSVSTAGQAGFIQGLSSISQDIYLSGGDYTLTFSIEGRGGATFPGLAATSNKVKVTLGNITLYDSTPAQLSFATLTTSATGHLAAGDYELVFQGEDADSTTYDYTSFIDNVQLNKQTPLLTPTPEPTTWAMLGLGLGVLAWARRRLPAA